MEKELIDIFSELSYKDIKRIEFEDLSTYEINGREELAHVFYFDGTNETYCLKDQRWLKEENMSLESEEIKDIKKVLNEQTAKDFIKDFIKAFDDYKFYETDLDNQTYIAVVLNNENHIELYKTYKDVINGWKDDIRNDWVDCVLKLSIDEFNLLKEMKVIE